jgi:hypothetical protein
VAADCARVRPQLSTYHDAALPPEEQAFVATHLAECASCREAFSSMETALTALATLEGEDLSDLLPALGEDELDTRPLTHLLLGTILLGIFVATGAVLASARSGPTPSPPPPPSRGPVPAPTVGAEVGIEREGGATVLVAAPSRPAQRPPDPRVLPDPSEWLAALPPAPAPAAKPAPAPVAPVVPKPDAAKPKPPKPDPGPPPLPEVVAQYLGRLRVSTGLGYRGVTFFFVQDPQGRERFPRARNPDLPRVAELSPSRASGVQLRRGKSGSAVLAGELLDAPAGLRISTASFPLGSSRVEITAVPVRYEGLSRRRADPVLRAPVLLPSGSRLALYQDAQPGPVATFLGDLTHPAFEELKRLRLELNRLEPEARALEQRLRARIRGTRALRGLGISLQGQAVSLDVFGSARALSDALPKLVRTALLEDHLGSTFGPDDESVEWRATQITEGVAHTRSGHVSLLGSLAAAVRAEAPGPRQRVDGIYRTPDRAGLVVLDGKRVFHAAAVSRSRQ